MKTQEDAQHHQSLNISEKNISKKLQLCIEAVSNIVLAQKASQAFRPKQPRQGRKIGE